VWSTNQSVRCGRRLAVDFRL